MTGRCDFLSGHSHAAFTHEPERRDSVTRANIAMNIITNAGSEIIPADSSYAIKTTISRKSPDGFASRFFPGASVRIDADKSRVGTYRVVSVIGSNLVLRRVSSVFKRPKCNNRMIRDAETARLDDTVTPHE